MTALALALTLCAAPALRVHHGAHFEYSVPAGWAHQESPIEVAMLGPDGASLVITHLPSVYGRATARELFAARLVELALGGAKVISMRDGGPDALEAELRYDIAGVPTRARWRCTVRRQGNRYDATLAVFQAPESLYARVEGWLTALAQGVVPRAQGKEAVARR